LKKTQLEAFVVENSSEIETFTQVLLQTAPQSLVLL